MSLRLLGCLGVVAVVLGACGAASEAAGPDIPEAFVAEFESLADQHQIDAVADGVVTESEMRRGLDSLATCLEGVGYELQDVAIDPFYGSPRFGYFLVSRSSSDPGPATRCESVHVGYMNYVASQGPEMLDPGVAVVAAACAQDLGFDVPDQPATVAEVLGTEASSAADPDVITCLSEAAEQQFPELNISIFGLNG